MTETTILHAALWSLIAFSLATSCWHMVLIRNTKRKAEVDMLLFRTYAYSTHLIQAFHELILSGALPPDDRIMEVEAAYEAVNGFMESLEDKYDDMVFNNKNYVKFTREHRDFITKIMLWSELEGRELKVKLMVEEVANMNREGK